MSDTYRRYVQTSVTNFLCCGDEYLFLQRSLQKKIDPGRLNGVGGRVEPGENYLEAAIRETEEETGYVVTASDVRLAGVVRLEGGYDEDWVMCFFKITVDSKEIPLGSETNDGRLLWLNKEAVLDSEYELVDDLNYCFTDIVAGEGVFFMSARLGPDQKITKASTSVLRH